MLDTLKTRVRARTFQDLVVFGLVFAVFLVLFTVIDALEWLVDLSHRYEHLELDELISSCIILCLLFAVFSFRRWQDIRKLSLYCEELSMIDPITMLPNRRVINRLLTDIYHGKHHQPCLPLSLVLIDINGQEEIQARFGNTVAEQAILELFYRYSLLLEANQLISYRNTNQCLLYCPQSNESQAQNLCEKIQQVELQSRQATLSLLSIKAVPVTLHDRKEIDGVFDRLEDLLSVTHHQDKQQTDNDWQPQTKLS